MNISFDKKLIGGFAICAVTVLVVAIISFRNGDDVVAASGLVNHTHEVIHELDQIVFNSVNAETSARGFIITNDESYLEPFKASGQRIVEHIEKARSLTAANALMQQRIEKIATLASAHLKDLENKIAARRKDAEVARQIVLSGEGRGIQDELRQVVAETKKIEQDLLNERSLISEREASSFSRLFISLLLIILVGLAAMYFVITGNLKALKKAETEAAQKNWTLTGNSDLAKRMQGNLEVNQLCQNVIDALVLYLNLPMGALYVRDSHSEGLLLQGSHALERSKLSSEWVKLGEGLAGQAAKEGRQIVLYDIKPEAYNVATSFGGVTPRSVLALPLKFEDAVVGVMEFGSLNEFTAQQRAFLDTVANPVAIGIIAATARQTAKELLEETQRQAEELETQQHELRLANEELEAKTEELERSEMELKTQQEELQQTNVELEEKANMLESQKLKLEEAKDEIEQKAHQIALSSKYKSEFLANMSHELRTPLNSILILSQLLGENKNNRLSDKEIEHARNIHSSGSDLLNLINEILDLSKIEAGKISLDVAPFSLSDVIATLNATFTEVAGTKAVAFHITCANENITLHSDRQRVEQILKNLLSNAFKFTPKGGNVRFEITEPAGDLISFSVTDTGIGIPADKIESVFEAFQQADGSTKRKYGGTGLGLSISRELAVALGGSIRLESEEGKGSRFTLLLPKTFDPSVTPTTDREVHISKRAPSFAERKTSAPPELETINIIDDRLNIRESDRLILIIEDDETFGKMLLNFVRERNYKGIIATQGSTGISYARHYRPDAIILDMKLPVMNGDEVLNHLKMDPDLRHIPVQIISGYDHQKRSLALGAFDYLMKPVAITDLHKAFDRIEAFKNKKLKKLLIIEDNPQQNNAIRDLIGNGDVTSHSAYSGAEAQTAMMKEKFDCIIVDLGLPDMSGFDLLENIRRDEKLSSTPVIVYTGKDLTKQEAARLGKLSDAVVIKTVNSHERLLDETMLFLHRVESKLPKAKQLMIRKLHRSGDVLKGRKVLVVDDDIRNIYSLTNVLDDEGVEYVTAENGKLALEKLNEDPSIELVLMDIMMPEMDGYEATAEIRKDVRFTKLPIIALTAKAMKGDKEKCLAAGMSDYVSKPVNIDQLLSLMRVWLYK